MTELRRYEYVWSFEPSMSGGIERDDGEWYRREDVDAEIARLLKRAVTLETVRHAADKVIEERGWLGRSQCTCARCECVLARACAAALWDAPDD